MKPAYMRISSVGLAFLLCLGLIGVMSNVASAGDINISEFGHKVKPGESPNADPDDPNIMIIRDPHATPQPTGGTAPSQPAGGNNTVSGNFTQGVNVAAGDINGDGVADIITGSGSTPFPPPAGGPLPNVFAPTNGGDVWTTPDCGPFCTPPGQNPFDSPFFLQDGMLAPNPNPEWNGTGGPFGNGGPNIRDLQFVQNNTIFFHHGDSNLAFSDFLVGIGNDLDRLPIQELTGDKR